MEVQKDLSIELAQVNARFAALSDEFRRNMSILRRSYERELTLLNAENIGALFQTMTKGLLEPDFARKIARNGREVIKKNQGATGRSVEQIARLLHATS